MAAYFHRDADDGEWEMLADNRALQKYPRTAFYLLQEGLLRSRFNLDQPDITDDGPHPTQIICRPFNIIINYYEKPHIELKAHIDFEIDGRLALSQRTSTIQDEVRMWTEAVMHKDDEHRFWLDYTIQGEEKAWQRNAMQILREFKATVFLSRDLHAYDAPLRMAFQIQMLNFVLGHDIPVGRDSENVTAFVTETDPYLPVVASEQFRRAVLPLLEHTMATLLQILCTTRGPYYRTSESFIVSLFSVFTILQVVAENKLDIPSFEHILRDAARSAGIDDLGAKARSDHDLMVFLFSFLFVQIEGVGNEERFFKPVSSPRDFESMRLVERDLIEKLKVEMSSALIGRNRANAMVKEAMESIFSSISPL